MEFILFSMIILLLLFHTKFITRKGNSITKLAWVVSTAPVLFSRTGRVHV